MKKWFNYNDVPCFTRKIFALFFILPSLLFVLTAAVLAIYTFIPIRLKVPEIQPAKNLTILAHGINDTPKTWSQDLATIIDRNQADSHAVALNWNDYAKSVFRCSVNGLRLGKKIGRHLSSRKEIKTVHLIGHSCGAFIVHGVCKGLRAGASTATIQATYLDPVSNFGGIFKNYGLSSFGSCADFADAYIDTGDSVPGSNQLLPQTHTFDVTPARDLSDYQGTPHLWPTQYYTKLVSTNQHPLLATDKNLQQKYPLNILVEVNQLPVN